MSLTQDSAPLDSSTGDISKLFFSSGSGSGRALDIVPFALANLGTFPAPPCVLMTDAVTKTSVCVNECAPVPEKEYLVKLTAWPSSEGTPPHKFKVLGVITC